MTGSLFGVTVRHSKATASGKILTKRLSKAKTSKIGKQEIHKAEQKGLQKVQLCDQSRIV